MCKQKKNLFCSLKLRNRNGFICRNGFKVSRQNYGIEMVFFFLILFINGNNEQIILMDLLMERIFINGNKEQILNGI